MKDLRVSLVVIPIFALALGGCGGGASTSPPGPVATTPTSSNASLQGQWQIVAHSNVNPASSVLVEANFSQAGSNISADKSNVVLIEGAPGAFTGLSGECDNGILGDDSVTATISGQTVSFTAHRSGLSRDGNVDRLGHTQRLPDHLRNIRYPRRVWLHRQERTLQARRSNRSPERSQDSLRIHGIDRLRHRHGFAIRLHTQRRRDRCGISDLANRESHRRDIRCDGCRPRANHASTSGFTCPRRITSSCTTPRSISSGV